MNDTNELLAQIKTMRNLAIPKDLYALDHIQMVFGRVSGETPTSWLVPCSHTLNTPANVATIENAERRLGYRIPDEYRDVLRITNGAKLFVVQRKWLQESFPGAAHTRFHLFGCAELVKVNKELLHAFLEAYTDDLEFKETESLNYMAFCDAGDGNYQAFLLEPAGETKPVFLLFYELLYRPYSELDADRYYMIAESLQSWFMLLLQSGGWEGRGSQTGGL